MHFDIDPAICRSPLAVEEVRRAVAEASVTESHITRCVIRWGLDAATAMRESTVRATAAEDGRLIKLTVDPADFVDPNLVFRMSRQRSL